MKKIILVLILLWLGNLSFAGDTIAVVHYNLLFYGHYTSFCTQQNNNADLKDGYLKTIIDHTRPDIFTVNELGRGEHNADRILDNVLNVENEGKYSRAAYTNHANSNLLNMLYYNNELFALYDEAVITSIVRDINLYTLYYKDPELENGADTTFVSFIVAHFKAGSSSQDQQTRTAEAQAVMGYIAQSGIRGNVIFGADFNMNSSFEQAYQLLTYHPDESIRFVDPIDKPGVWWNIPDMAPYHTQSPRTGTHPCFVTGGLDDRYDQILVTREMMEGTRGLEFIEGSYETIGQDGNRFNQSLIDPPNYSEPEEVIQALYDMSDHLPVKLKMATREILDTDVHIPSSGPELRIINPVKDKLEITLNDVMAGNAIIEIVSTLGKKVLSREKILHSSGNHFSVDVSGLPSGVYILRIQVGNKSLVSQKVVIY